MKVSDLKNNPDNPRIIKDAAFHKLKKSIKEFPQMMELRPMVVDSEGFVLGGNMRLQAIKDLGMKEIPDAWVKRADDLTEEQKKEFIIKDNSGFGEWDWDAIANEWSDLPLADWGLEVPTFEALEAEAESKDAEPQIDKAAELNKKWLVKTGDLWQIGEHRLLCGDSTKEAEIFKVLGAEKAEIIFSDPPYGVEIVSSDLKGGGDKAFGKVGTIHRGMKAKPIIEAGTYAPIIGDDTTDTAVDSFLIAHRLFPKAVHIWWGGNYYANALPPSSCWIVWDKDNGDSFFADAELAWTNQDTAVRVFKHTWNGLIKESERNQKRVHPTQKPVQLAEWCFDRYAKDKTIVLDPFCGSGMSLVACQNKGKRGCAIELSELYCAVILERMQTAFPELEIKRIDG